MGRDDVGDVGDDEGRAPTLASLMAELARDAAALGGDAARLAHVQADAQRLGLRVGERLGAGGTGLVFAVHHPHHGECVLKVPWVRGTNNHGPDRCTMPAGPTGPLGLRGLRSLAEADALLRGSVSRMRANEGCPPLPRLLGSLELGGLTCAVLERVRGVTLADLPREDPRRKRVLAALARATARLHESFGAHGDLKPANVLCTAEGVALIDPLPEESGWIGTRGFSLCLPLDETRDLVALSESVAQLWGTTLDYSSLESRLINRINGRFGRGWKEALDAARQELPRRVAALPPSLGEWICRVGSHGLRKAGLADPRAGTEPIHWSAERLAELARAAEAA